MNPRHQSLILLTLGLWSVTALADASRLCAVGSFDDRLRQAFASRARAAEGADETATRVRSLRENLARAQADFDAAEAQRFEAWRQADADYVPHGGPTQQTVQAAARAHHRMARAYVDEATALRHMAQGSSELGAQDNAIRYFRQAGESFEAAARMMGDDALDPSRFAQLSPEMRQTIRGRYVDASIMYRMAGETQRAVEVLPLPVLTESIESAVSGGVSRGARARDPVRRLAELQNIYHEYNYAAAGVEKLMRFNLTDAAGRSRFTFEHLRQFRQGAERARREMDEILRNQR